MATRVNRSVAASKKHANGFSHHLGDAVHSIEHKIEEQAERAARDVKKERKEGGFVRLVICVGGIYASL